MSGQNHRTKLLKQPVYKAVKFLEAARWVYALRFFAKLGKIKWDSSTKIIMALILDTALNNRYRILSILGQGGMGSVYRALDENIGIQVAVKENLFLSDEYARQFQREASILASLRHANLPRVGDYFVLPNQGQYLIMDYIDGEDLRQRIERVNSLPEREVILIGTFICEALSYMHSRVPSVIHRDIKPGNIKITPEGEVFLVDFGLAKIMQDSQATTTGARAMTPGYSPPEQYGTARTDARSDIYSLGATLYAALTGTIPEDGLARATNKAELTPIRHLQPRIGRRLANVIEHALEIEPEDRYQTAAEFRHDLVMAGEISHYFPERITISPPPPVSEQTVEGEEQSSVEVKKPPSQPPHPVRRSTLFRKRRNRRIAQTLGVVLLLFLLPTLYFLLPDASASLAAIAAPFSRPTETSVRVAGVISSDTPMPTAPLPATPTSLIPTPTATATLLPAIQKTLQRPTVTLPPQPAATPLGGGYGEMAFVSQRTGNLQIWLMDANGENMRQITNVKDGACQPSWSPDGRQLAFISPCDGKKDSYTGTKIYLINVDGSNMRMVPIPYSPAGDYDPAWSPDGDRIAFTSLRSEKSHIFVYNLRSQNLEEISESRSADKQPTWAPLGTEIIVFIRESLNNQLWLVTTDGRPPMQLTRSGNVLNQWPVWAPNGKAIYFSQFPIDSSIPSLASTRYEDRFSPREDRILPRSGDNVINLPIAKPSVSPDSQWIVFESWPDGRNHDIYIMKANGDDARRLTTDPGFEFNPVWRPAPPRN